MAHGFLYLSAILKVASRKVLAFRLSNTQTAEFCVEALEKAISKFGVPEIGDLQHRPGIAADERSCKPRSSRARTQDLFFAAISLARVNEPSYYPRTHVPARIPIASSLLAMTNLVGNRPVCTV
jgi:transposase InsO family protein